jgi:hypothetical protein
MSQNERHKTSNEYERERYSRPLPPNMGRDPLGHGNPRTGPDVGVAKNTGPGKGGGTKQKGGGSKGDRRS